MNYKASKEPIVPAINDTPALLLGLKDRLATLTQHDIPFFLMPVRLETRFMRVKKNLILEGKGTPATVKNTLTKAKEFTTFLQSVTNFRGFGVDNATEFSTELQAEATTIIGAVNEQELTSLPKESLQSSIEILEGIKAAALVAQTNLPEPTTSPSPTDSVWNAFTGIDTAVSAKIGLLQNALDNGNYDNSWKEEVNPEFKNQLSDWIGGESNSLSNQISQQPSNLDAYYDYKRKVLELNQILIGNSVPETDSSDVQYFIETLRPVLASQLAAIYSGVDTLTTTEKTSILPVVYQIGKSIKNVIQNALIRNTNELQNTRIDRFEESTGLAIEATNTEELPSNITQLGESLKNQVIDLNTIERSLSSNEELSLIEGILNSYLGRLQDIHLLLLAQQSNNSQEGSNYLYNIIKPIDASIDNVFRKLDSGEKSEPILSLLDNIDKKGFDIGYQLTKFRGIDRLGSDLFNPTQTFEELWIRVYPDDIAINSHEKKLTAAETVSGTDYWMLWGTSYGNPDVQLKAWQILATTYGSERAAWIVKVTAPTNLVAITNSFSGVYKLYPQLSTLTAYTQQLNEISLSQSQQTILADPQWEVFIPSLDSALDKVGNLKPLPQAEFTQLTDAFVNLKESFITLGVNARNIPPLNNPDPGQEPPETEDPENPTPVKTPFNLENTLQAITGKIGVLGTQISETPIIDKWPVVDGPIIGDTGDPKETKFSEAAFSNVLPDKFLFATVNKYDVSKSPNPVKDPRFGSYTFGHIKIGNPIPAKLPTGIDPIAGTYATNALGQLQIDPQIRWMVDFKEAVRIGMGVEIPLTSGEFQKGFDVILALGLKLGEANAIAEENQIVSLGKTLLEDLLENHHYTPGGLSITEVGTPTNNTDEKNTEFGVQDEEYKASFAIEVQSPLFNPIQQQELTGKKDGQLLAEALGITHTVLQHVKNAGGKQISNAVSINRALYNGTIGSYMRDMMGFIFTDKNVENTRDYFTDYVLARGTVPGIRIGRQPYSILPTTNLGKWEWKRTFHSELDGRQFRGEQDTYIGVKLSSYMVQEYEHLLGKQESNKYFSDRFNIRFESVVEELNKTWENIGNWYIKNVSKPTPNQQNDFLNILGLEPSLSESYSKIFANNKLFIEEGNQDPNYYMRYFNDFSIDLGWSGINLPDYFRDLFKDYLFETNGYNVDHGSFNSGSQNISRGILEDDEAKVGIMDVTDFTYKYNNYSFLDRKKATDALRIFTSIFLEEKYLLYGSKVSESNNASPYLPPYLGGNYITWLKNSNLESIWKNNSFSSLPSRSLLFLLLRQSTLNIYKETAWDILEKDNVFRKTARKIIGSPEGIVLQQQKVGLQNKVLTKWDFLFDSLQTLLGGDLKDAVKYFMLYPIPYLPAPPYSTDFDKNIGDLGRELFEHYNSTLFANSPNGVNMDPVWKQVKLSDYLKENIQSSQATSYLDTITNQSGIRIGIQKHQNALNQLANCTTQELDKLLREHIDLCSYRLDAWNTGKVNKRLWENRKTDKSVSSQPRKTGIYLGSYGWLFDIRPKGGTGIKEIKSEHLPDTLTNNSGKVYYDSENLGFIQTQSMTHALAAALLRAGYDSERHNADNRFAVNLSSERVSKALKLLRGIQNGQTLNALIGYQIERGLHENHPNLELDAIIYALRRKFSLVDPIAQTGPQAGTTNAINASLVLDGVKLTTDIRSDFYDIIKQHPRKTFYQLYKANNTDAAGNSFFQVYNSYANSLQLDNQPFLPTLSTSQSNSKVEALLQEIDSAMEAIDALGDLAVAEGVFQVARGNTERAGSVLQAWGEGKSPTDPEIVKTPKNGIHITHKIAVALEKKSAQYNPWTTVPLTPRALAEPSLNGWVAQIVDAYQQGSAANLVDSVGCTVSYSNVLGYTYSYELTLKDLALQPLDLLNTVTQNGFSEELDKRIRYFIRAKFSLLVDAPVQIDYNSTPTLPNTFSDLHSILFAIQQILGTAKSLEADDFISVASYPVGSTSVSEFDTVGLQDQVDSMAAALDTLVQQAQSIAMFSSDTLIAQGRAILLQASNFNLPQAIPDSGGDSLLEQQAIEDLWKTFSGVRETLLAKQLEIQTLSTQPTNLSGKALVDQLIKIIKALLGEKFLVVPHFSFNKYQNLQDEVKATLYPTTSAQDILRNHSSRVELVDDWLFGLARVNETASHIETIRLLNDSDVSTFSSTTIPLVEMRPVQFPRPGGQSAPASYWLGVEYPQTYKPIGDTLSVAIFDYGNLDLAIPSSYNCGLLLDSWVEVIPDSEITTGVTFNYDQPSAKPPQTILLAVSPQVIQDLNPNNVDTKKRWRLDDLLYSLLDTIDLAKMRLVEPDLFRKAFVDSNNNSKSDINPYTNAPASATDQTNTEYFEIFKWVLPAVVGEITPIINADQPNRYYAGKADSVQQVSFDYNPNNDTPSKAGGTTIDPGTTSMYNMETIAAREVLEDETIKDFLYEQERLSGLAFLEQQLLNQIENQ